MNVLYIGVLYPWKDEQWLLTQSKVGLPGAMNRFHWNVINGIRENGCSIDVISCLPVGNFPGRDKRLIWKSRSLSNEGLEITEIGCINFYIIKHIWREYQARKVIEKWLIKNDKPGNQIIVCDLYLPFLNAVESAKIRNAKTCLIVTDLPGGLGRDEGRGIIGNRLLEIRAQKQLAAIESFDSYVLLTKQMTSIIPCGNKPITVIEGMVECIERHCTSVEEKIFLYAGGIERQYGIEVLLQAFAELKDEKARLWFCGSGNAVSLVKDYEISDPRIKYCGYINKEEMEEMQGKAYAFVNPRNPDSGEYTKYSFPSKILDYLQFGQPIVAYMLPGMPTEYKEHLILPEDNSVERFKDALEMVLRLDKKSYCDIVKRNREFVRLSKNRKIQTLKILALNCEDA